MASKVELRSGHRPAALIRDHARERRRGAEESSLDAKLRDLAGYDRAFGVVFGAGQVLI